MERGQPIRPIKLRLLIGLLILVGGGVFFRNTKDVSFPDEQLIGTETIRHQLAKTYQHPLVTRQQTLTNRPVRQENMDIVVAIDLTEPLLGSGNIGILPAMRGSVEITQRVQLHNQVGSGSVSLSGSFLLPTNEGITNSGNEQLSGFLSKKEKIITAGIELNFLRSGSTTRWYLDDITVTQSGDMYDFLVIARAFLQEYEDSWIEQTSTPSWIRDLQLFALYEKLTHQVDQHLITSSGGSIQLVIDGPERGIDATLDSDSLLTAQFRFPEFGLRSSLVEQPNNGSYDFSLSHYLLPTPVLSGSMLFTSGRKALHSEGSWEGSRKNQLFYSGSHKFDILPIPLFTITPPDQYRTREDMLTGREKESSEK